MKRSLKMLLTMLFATVFLVSFALGTNAAWSYRWLIEPNPLYRSFDSVTEDFAVFSAENPTSISAALCACR